MDRRERNPGWLGSNSGHTDVLFSHPLPPSLLPTCPLFAGYTLTLPAYVIRVGEEWERHIEGRIGRRCRRIGSPSGSSHVWDCFWTPSEPSPNLLSEPCTHLLWGQEWRATLQITSSHTTESRGSHPTPRPLCMQAILSTLRP